MNLCCHEFGHTKHRTRSRSRTVGTKVDTETVYACESCLFYLIWNILLLKGHFYSITNMCKTWLSFPNMVLGDIMSNNGVNGNYSKSRTLTNYRDDASRYKYAAWNNFWTKKKSVGNISWSTKKTISSKICVLIFECS